ncbi:MAG: hypothetical protein VZR33_07490 [Methanosphaera sp.]|nr:hypothetical protein [Methanosphaera sp.]
MKQMMTELEMLAKQTLEQGGEWFLLEQSEAGRLYKTQGKWCDGRNYFNTPSVFQVFDSEGKRVFTSESYINAYQFYQERLKR